LYNAIQSDGVQKPLMDYLLDYSDPARSALNIVALNQQLQSFGNVFYNQLGNLDPGYAYYQGAYPCQRNAAMANLLIKSSSASAWVKSRAKAFLAYCACFIWDPDFFSPDPTVSGGLGNQQSQYLQNKAQLATQIYTQPVMALNYQQSVSSIETNLINNINQFGSGYGSWHYQGAATEQALFGWLNLVNNGTISVAQFPKIALFGQWYLSGLTPPEVRYGNTRMYISDGDGNTEPEPGPGLLMTLLNPGSPALAQNLSWALKSEGYSTSTIDSFAAPSIVAVDFTIPQTDPQLTSQHVPGYHSMLRSGWDTPYENAVDFLYGGFYSAQGHAHNDTGRLAAYLLGAPVSIDWNPNLYYPEVPGRFQHSTVCLDSELSPYTWNQDNPPLNACGGQWSGSSPDATNLIQTSTFRGSSSATASWTKASDRTVFQRGVTLLNYDPKFAVVHVYDTFSGAQAGGAKTLTWNLMADPSKSVITPAGSYNVTVRQNISNNGVLPSNGTVGSLTGNGLQSFAFTGTNWTRHASGGVDFDVYTQNANGYSFLIGNWCDSENGNNSGNCSLESQDILRLHGAGGFDTWIVAREKGTSDPTVSLQSCGVQITLTGTLCFDQTYSQYDNGIGVQTLATYDASSHSAFGMTIAGGPAECVETISAVNCTIHGWTGSVRTITLPATYYAQQPVVIDASGNILAYSENGLSNQLSFSSSPQLMRTVSITAPVGGTYARLKFASAVSSTTPYLVRVPSGSAVTVQAPPGAYHAQWVMDSRQSQVFSVSVQ
jgi:hypothetical protein